MDNEQIDKICRCACCNDVIIGCYISNEEFIFEIEDKGWMLCDGNWYCKYCVEKLGLKE